MSNRGEGGLGVILSIVALAAIGAFMYWLNLQSQDIERQRVAAAAAEVEAERDLDAGDLLTNPATAVGRRAVIDSIAVAAGLGEAAFILALTETNSYPVLMTSDPIQRLRSAGLSIYGGDVVYVSGQIYTFNDSIRAVWVTQGAVDEGMADQIPLTPTFLLADSVLIK